MTTSRNATPTVVDLTDSEDDTAEVNQVCPSLLYSSYTFLYYCFEWSQLDK